ncbi:MAG TPA: hypothetical protein VGL77_11220 [Armatimonadota bacterium]|jgi:hypothetical protein
MKTLEHRVTRVGLALMLLTCLATTCALAYTGAQPLLLNSIPQATGAIQIDGSLRDWDDARPAVFVPFEQSLMTDLHPELQRVFAVPHTASVRACYDSQALYLGIEWQGPPPVAASAVKAGQPTDALALHLLTDRMAHVRIDPLTPGTQRTIRLWYDDAKTVSNAATQGGQCMITVGADKKSYLQEMRLPWKLLTQSGQTPADGRLQVMCDFSWSDLPAKTIALVPLQALHNQKFITAGLLTSPDKLFDISGYLPNPGSWGSLQFAAQPMPNETQRSVLATGSTVTNVAPAAQPPTIDGDLQGWEPGLFQQIAYATGYLGDRYSGKIAVMYDATNLYIALQAKTGAGLYNVEHESGQRGYWGGDNLQIRLYDGKRTVNLCAWYDSLTGQPALTADGKDLTAPFLLKLGAREAFKLAADGQGYSQEIALPFSALGVAVPKAGTAWKATFQLWWAGLVPQFSAYAEATLQSRGGLAYRYTIPAEANVTLGVYNGEGHLLRWIVRGAHRRAGANTEYWDGLDQWGQPFTAGTYQVKGIACAPIGLDYKMTIGNAGTPPWPTSDNKGDWMGDESNPQGATTDGEWVYLASPCAEKGWSIIGVDGTGQRQWGAGMNATPRCVSLAVSGNYLYALYSGPETTTTSRVYKTGTGQGRAILMCLDKRTGRAASFSLTSPALVVSRWPYRDDAVVSYLWNQRKEKTFNAGNYGGQPRYFLSDVGESTNALGIAATAERIYIALYDDDKLLVLDAATAKQVDEIPIPKPVGLRALPNGKLLAVSGTRVLEVDPQAKSTRVLIDHDLVAPHDITIDTAGNIFVSDWGTAFQVKVFTSAGSLLRAIGTPGGRPWVGKWDANGMLVPRGIAVTNAGKLWVAEDDNCPPRVSVWNAQSGALYKEYLGPSSYGGGNWFWVNPQDPSMVLTEGALFHVDYAQKTWTPVSTALRRMSLEQPFMPNGAAGMPATKTLRHDGKTYIYLSDGLSVTTLRLDGDVFTPVASLGQLNAELSVDGTGTDIWDSDLGHHRYLNWRPSFFAGHAGQLYSWSDQNGDGLVQQDEMQWAPMERGAAPLAPGQFGHWDSYWGIGIGPDGSLYFRTVNGKHSLVFRADIERWTASGVPVYMLATARKIIDRDDMNHVNGLYVTAANKLVISYGLEWQPLPKNAIECYDRDGKYLWAVARYPDVQQLDDPAATNMAGDFTIPGMGNVIGSWQWHLNQHSYLLTDDGLYLTALCDDNVGGPTQNWGESMRSYFQTPNGDAYLVNGGADSYHVLRITGLENAKRFTGTLVLTPADVQQAAASRQAVASAPAPAPKPVVRTGWMSKPPVIDGDLSGWDMASGVALAAEHNRSAEVALARDADTLYLAYRVHGATLVNKGADWRTLFITGDCADLVLSTGKALEKSHFAPMEGDTRLLFSLYNGVPIAVRYRPVVPGTTNGIRLMAATLDQIVRLTTAQVAVKRSGDGYTLEAAVPLAELGIAPGPPTDLRGDVGVIFADQTGANRALRLYYYNHNTKIVDDLTTEATLQPGEWGQIEMPLGENLLKNGGFEEPFAADAENGWVAMELRNGAKASLSNDLAHSGKQSLLLESEPVTFAPESYNLADYGAFLKSANGGKGGSGVVVTQRIAVTPGKKYWVKAHYRALNMSDGEKKNAGAGRGYIALSMSINWLGAKNPRESWQTLFGDYEDFTTWQTAVSRVPHMMSIPYTAPEGATKASVVLRLVDNYAGKHPLASVDDVEFVEAIGQ